MKILVTGGAGFIGSHLVDALVDRGEVTVLDNLSSGRLGNLQIGRARGKCAFLRRDLKVEPVPDLSDFETIFHLAANPEVRVGATNPSVHFNENVVSTYNLLEAVRRHGGTRLIAFASTSTVYGEAGRIPTGEDYGPLKPISTYGASKLACESLIAAYASSYGFRAVIFRLANVIGPRSTHGIIYDLVNKLKTNPRELEILGDGTQAKSYLHVSDCVSGMLTGMDKLDERVGILNVGGEDQISVLKIADVVCEEMGLKNVKVECRDALGDGRGWIGDVKLMRLDVSKLEELGWKPKMNSETAIRSAAKSVISELPSKEGDSLRSQRSSSDAAVQGRKSSM
jgi:UDP-glucose 4-epimerase